jgi:hypothetical protein
MYSEEPKDQIPRPNQEAPRSGGKRRRLATLVIPAVVALIIGFAIGRFTAPSGSTAPVAAASPNPSAVATALTTISDPTLATPSPSSSLSTSPSATATATASDPASTSSDSASGTAQPEYLSQATAVDDGGALNSPADATISGVEYPNSIQQTAGEGGGTTTVWDATQYGTFTAEVGIDDTQAADGQTARIVFMNQSSVQLGSVQVSIGSPAKVSIRLDGAVHFEINCIAVDSDAGYLVTFGNAQFVP